jgi:hypothetical protein
MPQAITRDFIRTLAAANGLTIPEDRLDVVLRQYEGFMRTLEKINTLPLPRESEPATTYSLPLQPPKRPTGADSGSGR